jgi:hypothetical protein
MCDIFHLDSSHQFPITEDGYRVGDLREFLQFMGNVYDYNALIPESPYRVE